MRSHDTTSEHDPKSRAAANDRQRKEGTAKVKTVSADSTTQRKHSDMINGSPYLVSQRKRLRGLSGQPLQKQSTPEEDEELMQGKFSAQLQPEEEEELMQGKFAAQRQTPEEDEELMQGKFKTLRSAALEAGNKRALQRKTKPPSENRTGIPDELKAGMESTLKTDLSQVRINPNSSKATEVGALAYTQGTDVHFAPGQFKPESSKGQQLLGHELTHVVQQSQGRVQPTGEVAGLPVNDNPVLEKEADEIGAKAPELKPRKTHKD